MAVLKPFCAYHPTKELASVMAALPYDVYNREESVQVVKDNPMSFLGIDRAETWFDLNTTGAKVDTYAKEVYAKANELLQQAIHEGRYVQDNKPQYYIYALTMDGRCQRGFVGCASIDDYEKGIVKKHENTRADKEADRICHVDSCSMQTGPIFLTYKSNTYLKNVLDDICAKEAEFDFTSEDDVRHQVWKIEDDAIISSIYREFSEISALYIADGHHRCASAVAVGKKRREMYPDYNGNEEFNSFLSVVFPADELSIMDYNRVLKDLNGLSEQELLDCLKEHFSVEEVSTKGTPYTPKAKGEFGFYINQKWYKLTVSNIDEPNDVVEALDVSVLQTYVLTPLFGIDDPKVDKRIDFVGGIRGLSELEKRCENDCVCAFSMYPTGIDELLAVADAGLLMPPKSTWFEPKLRSGIFLHEIER